VPATVATGPTVAPFGEITATHHPYAEAPPCRSFPWAWSLWRRHHHVNTRQVARIKARRQGIYARRTGFPSHRPGRDSRSAFIISHSFDRSRYLTASLTAIAPIEWAPRDIWRNPHGMGHEPSGLKTCYTRILNTSYKLILSKKIAVHTSWHTMIVIIVTSRCAKDLLGIVENCPTVPSRASGTPALMRRLRAEPATGE
jgi:hypothetical protein